MSWNYRIEHDKETDCFRLVEAYYNKQGGIYGVTEDAVKLDYYESVADLVDDLQRMAKDAKKYRDQVLDSDMEYAPDDFDVDKHNREEE